MLQDLECEDVSAYTDEVGYRNALASKNKSEAFLTLFDAIYNKINISITKQFFKRRESAISRRIFETVDARILAVKVKS